MGLAHELLDSVSRARRRADRLGPADRRRAVSTAYYALFHLLVAEACESLVKGRGLDECRASLAREFEHRTMRAVSEAFAAARPQVLEICPRA